MARPIPKLQVLWKNFFVEIFRSVILSSMWRQMGEIGFIQSVVCGVRDSFFMF